MRDELQNKLFEAGPILYSLRNLPVTECLMCWGICCPDEWFDVIYELTLKLEKYNETHPYQPVLAAQVKEKFGELRFYIRRECENNEYAMKTINHYESKIRAMKENKDGNKQSRPKRRGIEPTKNKK